MKQLHRSYDKESCAWMSCFISSKAVFHLTTVQSIGASETWVLILVLPALGWVDFLIWKMGAVYLLCQIEVRISDNVVKLLMHFLAFGTCTIHGDGGGQQCRCSYSRSSWAVPTELAELVSSSHHCRVATWLWPGTPRTPQPSAAKTPHRLCSLFV